VRDLGLDGKIILKFELIKIGYKRVERNEPVQGRIPWQNIANPIINFRVQRKHKISSPDD
jgi:hypothetical protein